MNLYFLSPQYAGYFAIDHMTGVLSVAASLDRELQEIVTLNITATDQGPGNNQANVSLEPESILLLFFLFVCLFVCLFALWGG